MAMGSGSHSLSASILNTPVENALPRSFKPPLTHVQQIAEYRRQNPKLDNKDPKKDERGPGYKADKTLNLMGQVTESHSKKGYGIGFVSKVNRIMKPMLSFGGNEHLLTNCGPGR